MLFFVSPYFNVIGAMTEGWGSPKGDGWGDLGVFFLLFALLFSVVSIETFSRYQELFGCVVES